MLIPYINNVYRQICLKNFLIVNNEAHIHWHGPGRNRLLHEVLGCALTIILMIFF